MRKLLALLAFMLAATQAHAQATVEQCIRATPTGPCQAVNAGNPLPVSGGGGGGTYPVTAAPRSAITVQGCVVGTSSALCVPASTATTWIQVQNTHATNSVACSWGGTAILNDAGSFMLAAGQSASWGVLSAGVPTNALNCIASGATTPLYVEYR